MSIIVTERASRAIEEGRVFRAEVFSDALGVDGFLVGIKVGASPVALTNRVYTATFSRLTVRLYEVAFTGGTAANVGNRKLASGGEQPPATVMENVTATLGQFKFQGILLAGSPNGFVQTSFVGDDKEFTLTAGAGYVLQFQNTSGVPPVLVEEVFMSFDMRDKRKLNIFNEFHS